MGATQSSKAEAEQRLRESIIKQKAAVRVCEQDTERAQTVFETAKKGKQNKHALEKLARNLVRIRGKGDRLQRMCTIMESTLDRASESVDRASMIRDTLDVVQQCTANCAALATDSDSIIGAFAEMDKQLAALDEADGITAAASDKADGVYGQDFEEQVKELLAAEDETVQPKSKKRAASPQRKQLLLQTTNELESLIKRHSEL